MAGWGTRGGDGSWRSAWWDDGNWGGHSSWGSAWWGDGNWDGNWGSRGGGGGGRWISVPK